MFAGQTFNLVQMQKLFASQRSLGPCLPSLATTDMNGCVYECVYECVCMCGFCSGKLPKPNAYCKLKCAASEQGDLPRRGVIAVFVASSKQTCYVRAATRQAESCPSVCLSIDCSTTAIITHSIFVLRCLHQIAYTQGETTETAGKCLLVL